MTNVCKQCGASLPIRKKGKNNKNFCSQKCFNAWLRANRIMNCKCAYCGKPIHRKPYRLKRCKHGITCSKECNNKYRSIWFSGKNNHQYGLVGELNASFKSHQHKTVYGYITEEAPGHPFPQDKYDGVTHVLQHRLIVEQNYKMFDPDAFVIINGKHYLKQEYIVHHINKNKADNRLENLQVMTKGEHSRLHCLENTIIRDKKSGRIIGVIKSGKNGEPCDGNTVLTPSITKGEEEV